MSGGTRIALGGLCAAIALASPGAARHRTMRGKAIYYARDLEGETMACGGKYRPHKMIAAHRRLPCGTRLRVKNLRNDRVVTVTVKDRGPYGKDASPHAGPSGTEESEPPGPENDPRPLPPRRHD